MKSSVMKFRLISLNCYCETRPRSPHVTNYMATIFVVLIDLKSKTVCWMVRRCMAADRLSAFDTAMRLQCQNATNLPRIPGDLYAGARTVYCLWRSAMFTRQRSLYALWNIIGKLLHRGGTPFQEDISAVIFLTATWMLRWRDESLLQDVIDAI